MKLGKLKRDIERLVARAAFSLPKDVESALRRARRREKKRLVCAALDRILDNAKIARAEGLAICQDTGLPVVFAEAGSSFKVSCALHKAIGEAVASGYAAHCLRPSSVDPMRRNKSYYGGAVIHWDFNPRLKGLRITILPKGFGSENKSRLMMFNPTVDFSAVEDFIVQSVKDAGPEACPPFVVGVGIGGTSDECLLLAKKALLSNIGRLSPRERTMLRRINGLGIGVMGLGGKTTALGVKIKTAPTHIAGLPVGVNIGCHALRRATINISV